MSFETSKLAIRSYEFTTHSKVRNAVLLGPPDKDRTGRRGRGGTPDCRPALPTRLRPNQLPTRTSGFRVYCVRRMTVLDFVQLGGRDLTTAVPSSSWRRPCEAARACGLSLSPGQVPGSDTASTSRTSNGQGWKVFPTRRGNSVRQLGKDSSGPAYPDCAAPPRPERRRPPPSPGQWSAGFS